MKVHYERPSSVPYGYVDMAISDWAQAGLIPWVERCCDGRMMLIENQSFLTDDMDKVTCKRCLRKRNKYVKGNK